MVNGFAQMAARPVIVWGLRGTTEFAGDAEYSKLMLTDLKISR